MTQTHAVGNKEAILGNFLTSGLEVTEPWRCWATSTLNIPCFLTVLPTIKSLPDAAQIDFPQCFFCNSYLHRGTITSTPKHLLQPSLDDDYGAQGFGLDKEEDMNRLVQWKESERGKKRISRYLRAIGCETNVPDQPMSTHSRCPHPSTPLVDNHTTLPPIPSPRTQSSDWDSSCLDIEANMSGRSEESGIAEEVDYSGRIDHSGRTDHPHTPVSSPSLQADVISYHVFGLPADRGFTGLPTPDTNLNYIPLSVAHQEWTLVRRSSSTIASLDAENEAEWSYLDTELAWQAVLPPHDGGLQLGDRRIAQGPQINTLRSDLSSSSPSLDCTRKRSSIPLLEQVPITPIVFNLYRMGCWSAGAKWPSDDTIARLKWVRIIWALEPRPPPSLWIKNPTVIHAKQTMDRLCDMSDPAALDQAFNNRWYRLEEDSLGVRIGMWVWASMRVDWSTRFRAKAWLVLAFVDFEELAWQRVLATVSLMEEE
nr:uncharacterized protein CI109_006674 [Kwoniella shandongensis]KAA5525034.1 hypothetical protein CI109_006674 [Kwoniella shandongensis]